MLSSHPLAQAPVAVQKKEGQSSEKKDGQQTADTAPKPPGSEAKDGAPAASAAPSDGVASKPPAAAPSSSAAPTPHPSTTAPSKPPTVLPTQPPAVTKPPTPATAPKPPAPAPAAAAASPPVAAKPKESVLPKPPTPDAAPSLPPATTPAPSTSTVLPPAPKPAALTAPPAASAQPPKPATAPSSAPIPQPPRPATAASAPPSSLSQPSKPATPSAATATSAAAHKPATPSASLPQPPKPATPTPTSAASSAPAKPAAAAPNSSPAAAAAPAAKPAAPPAPAAHSSAAAAKPLPTAPVPGAPASVGFAAGGTPAAQPKPVAPAKTTPAAPSSAAQAPAAGKPVAATAGGAAGAGAGKALPGGTAAGAKPTGAGGLSAGGGATGAASPGKGVGSLGAAGAGGASKSGLPVSGAGSGPVGRGTGLVGPGPGAGAHSSLSKLQQQRLAAQQQMQHHHMMQHPYLHHPHHAMVHHQHPHHPPHKPGAHGVSKSPHSMAPSLPGMQPYMMPGAGPSPHLPHHSAAMSHPPGPHGNPSAYGRMVQGATHSDGARPPYPSFAALVGSSGLGPTPPSAAGRGGAPPPAAPKVKQETPGPLPPTAEALRKVLELPLDAEAAANMARLPGKGLPIYALEGDGKGPAERKPDGPRVSYGRLLYKGNSRNGSVLCDTPEGVQKMGLMKFLKLAGNTSSRPRGAIFLCATNEALSEFERKNAPEGPLGGGDGEAEDGGEGGGAGQEGAKEKAEGQQEGGGERPGGDGAAAAKGEAGAGPGKKKKGAGKPVAQEYVCEEDDRIQDVAKLYEVEVQDIVDKNKSRYKGITKTSKFKAGTVLKIPPKRVPGQDGVMVKVEDLDGDGKKAKRKGEGGEGEGKAKKPRKPKVVEEEVEETPEEVMAAAKDDDNIKVVALRQVNLTDRMPFNVVRDTDPDLWEKYREDTLKTSSFEVLARKLAFLDEQLLPVVKKQSWLENRQAAWAQACTVCGSAKAANEAMREYFLEGMDWDAVNRYWDMADEEDADDAEERDVIAPEGLVEGLKGGLAVHAEGAAHDTDAKRVEGKLYVGRHPKHGAPIWLVEVAGSGGAAPQTMKLTAFAQQAGGGKGKGQALRRVMVTSKETSLHDWLVQEGHMEKTEEGGRGSVGAACGVDVKERIQQLSGSDNKVGQGVVRVLQVIDRVPFAAVKQKKVEVWKEFHEKLMAASDAGEIARQVAWLGEQLVTKVMHASWMSTNKSEWDMNCARCDSLKQLHMLVMELEDDAINWRSVESRWAHEKDRPDREKRSKKDKDGAGKAEEGPCPFPLPVKTARLPEGWTVATEGTNVFRMDEYVVTLKTPDGLYLHTIDDVLKYYTLTNELDKFTENVRRGFLHTLQDAKATYMNHVKKSARKLSLLPLSVQAAFAEADTRFANRCHPQARRMDDGPPEPSSVRATPAKLPKLQTGAGSAAASPQEAAKALGASQGGGTGGAVSNGLAGASGAGAGGVLGSPTGATSVQTAVVSALQKAEQRVGVTASADDADLAAQLVMAAAASRTHASPKKPSTAAAPATSATAPSPLRPTQRAPTGAPAPAPTPAPHPASTPAAPADPPTAAPTQPPPSAAAATSTTPASQPAAQPDGAATGPAHAAASSPQARAEPRAADGSEGSQSASQGSGAVEQTAAASSAGSAEAAARPHPDEGSGGDAEKAASAAGGDSEMKGGDAAGGKLEDVDKTATEEAAEPPTGSADGAGAEPEKSERKQDAMDID